MKSTCITAGVFCLAILTQAAQAQTLPPPEKCFGVIELGSKGIKAIVVEDKGLDANKLLLPPFTIEEFKPKNKNPYDGDTAPQVAQEVLNIKSSMIGKYHMPENQIYVVMSSGIPAEVKAKLEGKQVKGIELQSIDAPTESRYVFQGIVPPHRYGKNEVVVLDIGSGNSKGAYLDEPPATFETYALQMGTGTFSKEVTKLKQNGEDFKAVAMKLAGEELLAPLQGQIRNKPGMQNCSRLYLAGGLPYVMTTLLHPERIGSKDPEDPAGKKTSDWVPLSAADINRFYELATTNPAALLKPDRSKLKGDLKAANEELDRVIGIFNQDELTAGAILLKLFTDNMHAERKDGIFFSRRALYAWPQGYVKEKIAARY
ncbi:Ppx/GppA phosphatase family protein [Roseimicrobium gellanilyticum]|uniref:Ppx/GppA phosphatase family protein n=1 Tax=Roseimicrobium gellanilyticum TaxID=748857 RepID=A0A366HG97_9BACT|nr:hypothetical protein [Roseimicrobium gellanilyticum]RBP41231.1 Ppx/GppA phosphatase family protein [Roseimicrobium gellanilyticum]